MFIFLLVTVIQLMCLGEITRNLSLLQKPAQLTTFSLKVHPHTTFINYVRKEKNIVYILKSSCSVIVV